MQRKVIIMTTDNMGDAPVPVESLTRRVSRDTPVDPIGQLRAAMAQHDRQVREANRPTGTELRHTAHLVDSQHDDIAHALDEAAQAQDMAAGAADKAAAASEAADRATAGVRRVDGSRVVAADVHETPEIGPDPVRLVQEKVPVVAGYGRVRVSVAAFGSVPFRGPVALQVRLRVGGHVTAWLMASYAGDGVPYPGDVAPVRSFSLTDYVEWVDPGAVLAVEAMCPAGAHPGSLSGMAHLSARIDYMEVV